MYFKELDVAGFKSFADRLEIKFDNGVTAIVGPNGCGKSNVADAIRWVLGEQSSKLLRGSCMQDVIFNGTTERKSLSYAEVTLEFDNQDRFFNYDADQLAITRKLYRSGESEYLINRVSCRLKDIIDLLHDSGIGRDGYSIIGQGKVEEIISSKPENRRAIFEEAAGISKFKSRKVESERKLERVRDNLTRLRDIISEIERQIEPLKKQSENAKKYLELRDILKDLETNIYIYQYDHASSVKEQINIKLNALLEQLSLRQGELDSANNKYNSNMDEINNIDNLMNSLHNEILQLTVDLEKQAGEVKIIKERVNILNEQNDKINVDILNQKNNVLKLGLEKEQLTKELEEDKNKLTSSKKELDTTTDRYMLVIDELALSEDEADESQKQMISALDKLTDIKSKSSRLEAEKKASEENIAEIDERLNALNAKLADQKLGEQTAKDAVDDAREQKTYYEKACAETQVEINSLASLIKDKESASNNNFAKIQVYENRKRLLEDMQAEFEGYAGSVKKLLKESENNKAISSKMVGVLANLIKVEQKYETAIEMALGNAVQNIVTFDEDGAKDLIGFLKNNQYGRATFMPISTMRPRSLTQADANAIKMSGVCGVASQLISYDKNIESVISNLLGGTVIVDTLDTAVKLASVAHYSFKIVTLDGDIVNPQGSMTGGSKKSEMVNLISREREIKTLGEEIIKMKNQIEADKTEISSLNIKISTLEEKHQKQLNSKNDAEVIFAKESEKLDNIEFTLYEINDSIESSNRQKQNNLNKIKFIDEELGSVSGLVSSEITNRKAVNENIENHQAKFNDLRKEKDVLTEKVTELKVKISTLDSNIINKQSRLEQITFDVDDGNMIIAELNEELERNRKTIVGAESLINDHIDTSAGKETKRKLDFAREQLGSLDTKKLDIQKSLKEIDEQKNTLINDIQHLNERKYNEDMNLQKVDTELETMQERIFEEYGLTYDSCLDFKRADFDINSSMVELNKTKKEINRLGYVNVNAIEDYKALNERYCGITEQVEDLEKSEGDLTKIIKELSQEMITRFDTEFNKINENFKQTFKELFGGGNARLELTDSENMLEAGVEIYAEPPGKKLQSITLMSGGEKALTAIAILFAILKLRPMPFCLLDEIEAALDDANVDRFAQYLRKFSKETQFIVITHRKPTMELADSLYGVTMQEKGVSKIVSVKLSDAVKNVEVV